MQASSEVSKEPLSVKHRHLIVIIGCLGLFSFLATGSVADLDMWHQMSLARELFTLGHIPWTNTASFMQGIEPVVHHEWGAGLVAYLVGSSLGAFGLAMLRSGLIWGLATVIWRTAIRKGCSNEALSFLVPVAALLMYLSFSPIRAQMYTFLFLAIMLDWLDRDRFAQSKSWVLAWLVLYTLWLNLHAGFLVGAGLFFLYWLELLVRGLPHRHLLVTGLAMVPLILINPYGIHYVEYLYQAILLDRTYIIEWKSTWMVGDFFLLAPLGISLALLVYAIYCRGLRELMGITLVLATLVAALTTVRMVALFGITWMVFVPAWLAHTPLECQFHRLWHKMSNFLPALWINNSLVFWTLWLMANPFVLRVPGTLLHAKKPNFIYPVGAISYLKESDLPTNLIVPFEIGAYVTWKLPGLVKVSMDSRYEAAYPPHLANEHFQLYRAEPGWQQTLALYDEADAILIPYWEALASVFEEAEPPEWRKVYHDVYFSIYSRTDHPLPTQKESGSIPEDTIP